MPDTTGLDITGGYIFELSEEYDDPSKFTTYSGNLQVKTMFSRPEMAGTSTAMMDWCRGYMQDYWDAVTSATRRNSKGRYYTEYADMDSMVAFTLVNELFANNDAKKKSRYVYIDRGGKLVFGPVWDFDWGCSSIRVGQSPEYWACSKDEDPERSKPYSIQKEWASDVNFCRRLYTRYWEIRGRYEEIFRDGGLIDRYAEVLAEAGRMDESLSKYRAVLSKYPASESASRIKDIVRLRDLEDGGRGLYREYRFAEAQKVFREVAAKDASRKPRMDYLEAMCLYGQGLDEEAEKLVKRLAAESSDAEVKAMAVLWLAKHSYNRGAWQEARRLFAEYAEKSPYSPDAPEALVWAARAHFAENDFQGAIQTATRLAEKYPGTSSSLRGLLVQGEALIELARFDEAVLVLERVSLADGVDAADRLRARLLGADALFAMGADNPVRYQEALEAYRGVRMGESLSPSQRISVSYKVAKTFEKLKRMDEAIDRYYADVVLAYRMSRAQNVRLDDEARAAFSRAAYESRGKDFQAMHILELVVASDVPASAEAARRIERIKRKGNFL